MTRLTYRDAVKILGAGNSPLVSALDKAFGWLLLGGTPFASDLLSIFDAKGELTRLTNELVSKGIDKRRRMGQFDRIQRLHAARGVLMVTAYFEAVEHADLPFPIQDARISGQEKVGLAVGAFDAESPAAVTTTILETDLPLLGVQVDSAQAEEQLGHFYRTLGKSVLEFLKGLSLWDGLDPARQLQAIGALERAVPAALRAFDVAVQRLATECPEFAIWLNLSGHRATRDRLKDIDTAVQTLLARAEPVEQVHPALQGVVRANRSILSRKLVAVAELPEGLDAPMVDEAYIDPYFRMVEVNAQTPVHDEDFWGGVDARTDFNAFLLGYLSTPWAWANPLVVLGHPGAGKSLLTEVQAARLPSPDFVSVRVPLRDVPADADIHEQIEHAIRLSTHESVSWPVFARAAGESLLVVLLDGFDELLQATGVGKSDYLLRVKRFQEVEETQGRHVAVIVTSRVTVADRMRIPGGTVAVRLEPFEIAQVEQWVDVWNETNAEYLDQAGGFDLEFIENHLDLASQPLLLLMLAVYEAESGTLGSSQAKLSQTELYERLLHRFARREVSKRDSRITDDDPAVERELMILSVVGFGMFNRGAQWITDDQLADDLVALQITTGSEQGFTSGHQRLAGEAKDALGRFFYIHRARTTLDGVDLGTYEFLHATFGEYLVARLVWRCLTDMVAEARLERTRMFPGGPRINDAGLRAFLSWSLLSVRTTTVDFLAEFAAGTPDEQLAETRAALLVAFRAVHQQQINSTYHAYRPVDMTQTAQLATYSANLLLLLMFFGPEVYSHELYPDAADHVAEWTRTVQLWQSQLRSGEWNSLTQRHSATRLGDRRTGRSVAVTTDPHPPHFDPAWTHTPEVTDEVETYEFPLSFLRSAEFSGDPDMVLVANALGGATSLFTRLLPHYLHEDGELTSVAADLVAASLFHANLTPRADRAAVYQRLLHFIGHAESIDSRMRGQLASHVLQLLVNDEVIGPVDGLRHLHSLSYAAGAPHGRHNFRLFLRLPSRIPNHKVLLVLIETLVSSNEMGLEQLAEIWCALAEQGIPTSEYPYELRDHSHSLRWPEREEPLAHRPDLLRRLSALEDDELL